MTQGATMTDPGSDDDPVVDPGAVPCSITIAGSRRNRNADVVIVSPPDSSCSYPGNDPYSCSVNASTGMSIDIRHTSGGSETRSLSADCSIPVSVQRPLDRASQSDKDTRNAAAL